MKYWHGELTLKELRMTNFRQFEALNIHFHEKLTVLIGENGSGKTTILEAIDKAMRLFSERIERADSYIDPRNFFFVSDINNQNDNSKVEVFTDIKVDDGTVIEHVQLKRADWKERLNEINKEIQSHFEEADLRIEKSRVDYDDNPDLFDRYKSEVERERDQKVNALKKEEEIIVVYKYEEDQEMEVLSEFNQDEVSWYVSIERNVRKKGEFDKVQKIEDYGETLDRIRKVTTDISIPFFKYYPCRDLDNTPAKGKTNGNGQNYRNNLVEEESTSIETFTTWYRRIERQSAEKNDFRLLQQIQKAIYELLSDEKSHRFDNLRLSYLNEEKPDGELWIDKNGGALKLEQLSSGETMLFLLVSDLARRFVLANPSSVEPYKTGSAIILIDEVDLHLHPQWQIKVLGKFCSLFPKAQFLVTTHSPLIITHLKPKESKVGLLKNVSKNLPLEWLSNYAGRTLEDFIYEFYGIKKRPETMQKELDELFDLIDRNKTDEARAKLETLKKQLGDSDAAILDAETIIEFA
jgi:predicted ATP-binding protein involved in virulence